MAGGSGLSLVESRTSRGLDEAVQAESRPRRGRDEAETSPDVGQTWPRSWPRSSARSVLDLVSTRLDSVQLDTSYLGLLEAGGQY